jgi:predicted O-methyltransferase YrrM
MFKAIKEYRRSLLAPWHRRKVLDHIEEFHSRPRTLEEVVRFALEIPGKGRFKVRTMQVLQEITGLAQAVKAIEPRVILEIGTAKGGTLFMWSQIASAKVVTCDLEQPDYKQPIYQAFPPPHSSCQVQTVAGDTHSVAVLEEVVRALDGETVDFLFIDGDHTERGVEADYHMYSQLVRPGGLIAFHDIAEQQPVATNEVQYFWKRLSPELDTEEFIADRSQCGYGIGLVRVAENGG